jgi:hypothetical protein
MSPYQLALLLLLSILDICLSTTSPPSQPPLYSAPSSEFDYEDAFHKSFLFLEAQRSGKLDLSRGQRVAWRGDSALQDGMNQGVGNDRSIDTVT